MTRKQIIRKFEHVKKLQHKFWDALSGLEDDLGIELDSTRNFDDMDVSELFDEEEDTCIVCDAPGNLEPSHCGSIHPDCAETHAEDCEVCRSDFINRGLVSDDNLDD